MSNLVQHIEIPYRMREILLIKTKKQKLQPLKGTNKISINSFAKWYESFYWPSLNQYWNLCDLRVKVFNQHCIGSSLTKASCGWIGSLRITWIKFLESDHFNYLFLFIYLEMFLIQTITLVRRRMGMFKKRQSLKHGHAVLNMSRLMGEVDRK